MSETIDITQVVEDLRASFVEWGVAYVFGLETALPGLEWLALPVIKEIDKAIIRSVLDFISKAPIMQAFFMNTAIRKSGEAKDFTAAVEAKNALPPTASQEEIEDAERKQMAAFRSFVILNQ